jgi:hypothetical protein
MQANELVKRGRPKAKLNARQRARLQEWEAARAVWNKTS